MPYELLAMEHGSELTGTGGSGSSEPSGYQKGCKFNTWDTASCLTVSAHELDLIAQASTNIKY